ncbi:hypothetical protein [Salana multivorans]
MASRAPTSVAMSEVSAVMLAPNAFCANAARSWVMSETTTSAT